MPDLLIRADASTQIGTGHVMRCLALAQAWRDQCGPVTFASALLPDALRDRLHAEGMSVHIIAAEIGSPEDAVSTSALADELRADWVVLDGYGFTTDYQRVLQQSAARILMLNDYAHQDAYAVDVILNQNSTASASWYAQRAPNADLLLGSRYALLRREFHPYRGYRREVTPSASNILVTLGGADPDNLTEQLLHALDRIDLRLDVRVVVGSSNPHRQRLITTAEQSHHHMSIVHNVQTMPELMTWADVAITAAGSTVWEAALVGLPLLTLTLADNQAAIAADLAQRGAAIDLGWCSAFDPGLASRRIAEIMLDHDARMRLSSVLQTIVDGYGVDRALRHLRGQPLWLRRALANDSRLIWTWANDPVTRAASFSSASIPWETHEQWFAAKLHASNCTFFIAYDPDDQPIGQVRFDDVDQPTAVISVAIDPQRRGRGLGSSLIDQATQRLFAEVPKLHRVDAWIKASNTASCRAFEKADYRLQATTLYHGHEAAHYARHRSKTALAKD